MFVCSPDYPFDMVTVLHVVLFKTADPEPSVRERAMQLLQLLDSRFLSESGHSRPELLGCLTGGTYSQSHIVFSKELATTNPELTFPIFSGRLISSSQKRVCEGFLSCQKWCTGLKWLLILVRGASSSTWYLGWPTWSWWRKTSHLHT